MPWGEMVEMQRLAHEAATESRQRRVEAKRKAEEEEAAKRLAEAEAKRQEREEARQKAEEQEKMELALAAERKLKETEAAIQAEFQPRFEAELQARESRRQEELEQKIEGGRRQKGRKGKRQRKQRQQRRQRRQQCTQSLVHGQPPKAGGHEDQGSAADAREEPGRDPDLANDAGRKHHAGAGPMSGTYFFQTNPTLFVSMFVHPNLLFHIQVV